MLYSRLMKSSDPRVVEAIAQRTNNLSEGIARVQRWREEKGADAMAGHVAFGAYRIIALTFDDFSKVPDGWNRVERVRDGYAPPAGSSDEDEMMSLACPLFPIPGLPQSFTGVSKRGKTAGTPELFSVDGVSYMALGFEPDAVQDEAPMSEAEWADCSEYEMRSARLEHQGRINEARG